MAQLIFVYLLSLVNKKSHMNCDYLILFNQPTQFSLLILCITGAVSYMFEAITPGQVVL
jgi:hypothetical protein